MKIDKVKIEKTKVIIYFIYVCPMSKAYRCLTFTTSSSPLTPIMQSGLSLGRLEGILSLTLSVPFVADIAIHSTLLNRHKKISPLRSVNAEDASL